MSRQPINDIESTVAEHLKNSIPTNRDFIKLIGIQAAVILGELVSKQRLYSQTDPPSTNNNDYFYYTIKTMENNTGYGRNIQKRELEKLKAAGLIDVYYHNGGKRRIRVNMEAVINTLSQLRTMSKWELVIPTDDNSDHARNQHGGKHDIDMEPCTNSTGSNYSLTINKNVVGGKNKKVNPTTEASEHYRKRFHDKHNQWPGKGLGTDRKQSNIILKPLITEYGLDKVKKAIDNWVNDDWVHREKPGLGHLAKNILKYMDKTKDDINYPLFVTCEKCGQSKSVDSETGKDLDNHECVIFNMITCPHCGKEVRQGENGSIGMHHCGEKYYADGVFYESFRDMAENNETG